MQNSACQRNNEMGCGGKVVDLNEYRLRVSGLDCQAGLPPKPRRRHRRGLVIPTSDLISMTMVVMTFAATGMILAGM